MGLRLGNLIARARNWHFEPTEYGPFGDPIVYGKNPAPHDRSTIRTIRLNAGKMPAQEIADALGWTLHRLETCASANRIDLTCPPRETQEREAEPRGA